MQKLCERLGMPYDERRMNFWEKEHHYFFGSAGTKQQVKRDGGSKVQNKRQFPQEFLDAYAAEEKWLSANPRFTAVLDALRNNDLSQPFEADSWQGEKLIKPAWYYRHIVKSAYRRVFPGPGAVQ